MEYSHEIIVPNDDLPFKMFIFEGSQGGYIRQKHWHRSIEIFAVFDGEMEFYLNDKRYPLHPGEFMLVNQMNCIPSMRPKRIKRWLYKYRLRHSKDIIQTTDSYIFLTVPGSRMKR